MKSIFRLSLLVLVALVGCSDDNGLSNDEFTGNEVSYDLVQSSDFPISGTVNFMERTDGDVQVVVSLEGTSGDIFHPVHLHFGDLTTPDADIAFLLNDLKGSEGSSVTTVAQLSDETDFTFESLESFNGSVKVHLGATGDDRNVILAAGNIGANKNTINGRRSVAICKSF